MSMTRNNPNPTVDTILIVGRSQIGKSTLIDSLEGYKIAASLSMARLSSIKWISDLNRGIRYGEIPDLSISPTGAEAAEELRKCLTERGSYKLVFVCALESGRIYADDVTTIKVVLDAINDETFPYSIVFNKTTRNICPEVEGRLLASLTSGHKPPAEVFYFPYDEQLDNGDITILKPNKEFQNFMERQQPGLIQPDKLLDFNLQVFDAFEHFQHEKNRAITPATSRDKSDMLSKFSVCLTSFEMPLHVTAYFYNGARSRYFIGTTIVIIALVLLPSVFYCSVNEAHMSAFKQLQQHRQHMVWYKDPFQNDGSVSSTEIQISTCGMNGAVVSKQQILGYLQCKHDGVHFWVNIPRPFIQENIDANRGQINISIDLGSILRDFKEARTYGATLRDFDIP